MEQPSLNYVTLRISPRTLETAFWKSNLAQTALRQADMVGLLVSVVLHIGVTFVHSSNNQQNVLVWVLPPLVAIIALAQLYLLFAHRGFYFKHRLAIQLANRLFRVLPTVLMLMQPPAQRQLQVFSAMEERARTMSSWKTLMFVLFYSGMARALGSFSYDVPYIYHLAFSFFILITDLTMVVPLMGCVIWRYKLERSAAPACFALDLFARLLFGLAPTAPIPLMDDNYFCAAPRVHWVLPVFACLTVGTVVPAIGLWWVELSRKRNYLLAAGHVRPGGLPWPFGMSREAFLACQMYTAVALVFCAAVAWPVVTGASVEAHCVVAGGV